MHYINIWVKSPTSTEQRLQVKELVWGKHGKSTRFSLTSKKL